MTYSLEDLHDGTLVGVELAWESGRVIFQLMTGEKELKIVVQGVMALECARKFPWGESVSLNEVILSEQNGQRELRIEMQSGDVLKALGKTVEVVSH